MTIADQFSAELKDAMRSGDKPRLDTVRMIISEILVAKTAPGFTGQVDDDLYLAVIAAQVKKDQKSIEEYRALGERGEPMVAKYEAEVAYLSQWLPTRLDEEATAELVAATIAELGVEGDPKAAGRVIGQIMKNHRDEVDGGLVNKVVRQALEG
ncbi:MAG: GatB/YqeY domain-containing protein [Acidimicrobiia bacterium]|nr:GatB/YqeY domain-containing protein [Acidimicrobiia bacterium]MDH4308013.1 GatB/YqeY domain-containing protein [Acidimicrobiia bacterium]MDH5292286.1 GatB/YqeY domain-containing protein [Acidimicrobiia bacterium]MDH5521620.1 GatB/YqeY domain-containing protein [Acidimicrobiia bacterium]